MLLVMILLASRETNAQKPSQQFEFVKFSDVIITDQFWKPKMDRVATVTLAACIDQTENKTGRIRNFIKVANHKGEKHEGIYYDDSDVYKALEAIAYSLKTRPNKSLEKKADEWIGYIAAAQMPDGYLNTYFQLRGIEGRWKDVEKHEDYNAGHLIEAAVAYYDATGKRTLLDVAIRLANHIDSTFRLANRPWFSGHQEIELALVKLYKATGNDRYLKLADWYLQERGKTNAVYNYDQSWIKPDYWQSQAPVYHQTQITGHAVRAMYLYTGAADVGALTGDEQYLKAMKAVWEDVVYRNMYLTGGIGAAGDNEGFTKDYDLPNQSAYCETCASVGMVFWNQRMAQLTGDAKYVDVLEKSLYNAALDGLSLSGDHFFYDNTLASTGGHERSEWFGTACCPANISRLIASLGDYIYGKSKTGVWVNLFVNSNAKMQVNNKSVGISTEANYPWDGKMKFTFGTSAPTRFTLHLRQPGWATGEASPGGLYNFANFKQQAITVTVNGKKQLLKAKDGYLEINRTWKTGDVVEYVLPMQPLTIIASDKLAQDRNKMALQRGPLIYCLEGADNNDEVWDLLMPLESAFTSKDYRVLSEPVIALEGSMDEVVANESGMGSMLREKKVVAVPYYTWANRGAGTMLVWLPTRIEHLSVNGRE